MDRDWDEVQGDRVAAARGWLELARERIAAGVGADAVVAAERGLADLGERYLGPDEAVAFEDDTTLKYLAAQQLVAQGSEHAATMLVRVLAERLARYDEHHGQGHADGASS